MSLYIFYPTSEAGLSSTFVARELLTERDAALTAQALLAEHPRCAYVAVWQDDSRLPSRHRRRTSAALEAA